MPFKITKKNFPLIVGLSIPFVMMLLVAVSIYLPAIGEKPSISFLYSTGNYYGKYYIESGKVAQKELTEKQKEYPQETKLYMYDMKKNSTKEISLEEAQKYNLDNHHLSSEGFTTKRAYNDGGIFDLFVGGWRHRNAIYISKGSYNKRLNVVCTYYNFRFLGWIKE